MGISIFAAIEYRYHHDKNVIAPSEVRIAIKSLLGNPEASFIDRVYLSYYAVLIHVELVKLAVAVSQVKIYR